MTLLRLGPLHVTWTLPWSVARLLWRPTAWRYPQGQYTTEWHGWGFRWFQLFIGWYR